MTTKPEAIWKVQQSEAQFQAAVQELATLQGWEWMHIGGRQMVSGFYRTPVSGSLGPGWPDLVLVRGEQMLFAELKSEKGRLSFPQKMVLNALVRTGHRVYLWKPSDWDQIVKVLE
jgi:VRR-NUC domain-containing protein